MRPKSETDIIFSFLDKTKYDAFLHYIIETKNNKLKTYDITFLKLVFFKNTHIQEIKNIEFATTKNQINK